MNTRRHTLAKVLLGLVLAVLAGFAAMVIQDALASRQPENALPVMEVWHSTGKGDEGQTLAASHVRRDRYEWRFLFTPQHGGGVDLTPWLEIQPAWVNPGARMRLEFSREPKTCQLYLVQGEGVFQPVEGEFNAPSTAGRYTYMVRAGWEAARNVDYYFVLEVPEW